MDDAITTPSLIAARASSTPPLVIDVRRAQAFVAAPSMISGALRRNPEHVLIWAAELPADASVVVYCVHGHAVSQDVARTLREKGIAARYLDHGIEGWREADAPLHEKPEGSPTRWVTRERPKIDRIACPWLIARFIDEAAEFLYVPTAQVDTVAREQSAVAYDTAGAQFGHIGDACSFDAFLQRFGLTGDPALTRLAEIVRGADTGRLDLAPESAGLLALSTGLSRLYSNDHAMLLEGMRMYDALYRWCQEGQPANATWHLCAASALE